MTRLLSIVLGCLLLVSAEPVLAQTAPPPADGVAVDSVLVRATQRKRLLTYVRAVSAFSPDSQIARRPNKLCPFVAGASAEVNTYVVSRIREVGQQVGVQFESKACQPNLLVLFSREPETMLRKARKLRKINFEPASPIAVQKFLTNEQPVRWWHSVVSIPVLGAISFAGEVDGGAEQSRLENTRIIPSTRSVIRGSLIVVDASQTNGVEVGALADYVAFAALTDIKPGVDLSGYASILNLFSSEAKAGTAVQRLTPTDMAYLRGVYQARDASSGMNQMGKIATIMAEELER